MSWIGLSVFCNAAFCCSPLAFVFLRASGHQILEMIKDIQEVFISNLQDLTWMDEQTKKAAEEKVYRLNETVLCVVLYYRLFL